MHPPLVRKLLTRPINRWEKTRSYPIRQTAFSLPTLPVNPDAETALIIMSTGDYLYDAAWAAQSLLRHMNGSFGLTVVIDGEAAPELIQKLKDLFPGVSVLDANEILKMSQAACPTVAAAGEGHPMVRKLATILMMQQDKNILYSDSDVLCLNEIPELNEVIGSGQTPFYLKHSDDCMAQEILQRAQELGYDHAVGLNAGFLYVPKQSLNTNIAEKILDGMDLSQCNPATWWWIEQTVVSVLMKQANAKPLPTSRYVVNGARQWYFQEDVDYDEIAVRHFVSSVRHLMYMRGMPHVLKQIQAKNQTPSK